MAKFRCGRFPKGEALIRTSSGTVVRFYDGQAEVDDPGLAEELLAVPAVFRVTQVDAPPPPPPPPPGGEDEGQGDDGDQGNRDGAEPDAAPADEVAGEQMPPGMSVPSALEWVGNDPARAQTALDAETAPGGRNRATLIARLETVLADGQQ